mgnify:CR=1 FL=1|tara:strand:+ start:404 stop:613 length:210 start_codon:yes stop_codon:yes gene_type:complete
MTKFENFINSVDCTANIIVKGIGVKSDWVHTTTPNNVSINGERVMFYDHKIQRWIHTQQKDLKSFEIVG